MKYINSKPLLVSKNIIGKDFATDSSLRNLEPLKSHPDLYKIRESNKFKWISQKNFN